ncbi:MAG: redoxin domain-containing protein [Pirellulales bacterium]|nr:redoxin domain-containing protein [Pirellulales bacterium]
MRAAEGLPAPLGQSISDFELRDVYGEPRRLTALAGERATVVVLLGTDCPLAQLYARQLVTLARQFADHGVAFVAIDPNSQDSLEDMLAFARRFEWTMPWLKDPQATMVDVLAARRVPEAFVLDAERRVRYRGRIDDQHQRQSGLNVDRAQARREDLKLAIEQLLAGQAIEMPVTEATGCLIGRPLPVAEDPSVTWSQDIAPLFARRCMSCHQPGAIGPFSFVHYDDVVGWGPMIAEVVGQGRMPPWAASPAHGQFANENRLSPAERDLIERWVAEGTPQGDPQAPAPKAPALASEWEIPPPDQVVYMAEQPFAVPAQGTIEYQYYVVDPGWQTDKWIRAAQCKPGEPAVVHHINVFTIPPEMHRTWTRDNLTNNLLQGYAPGFRATPLPEGSAFLAPAGTWLLFQMHYTAAGTPLADRSSLGLVFAAPEHVRQRVDWLLVFDDQIEIPPGAPDYQASAQWEFAEDVELLALNPHMHLRGRSFRHEMYYPDSTREVLLEIPRFDFNWQNLYELVAAKHLPAGSIARCEAVFDNSTDNPLNPDPAATVRWGDQTTDEMFIGYMLIGRPRDAGPIRAKYATPPPPVGDSLATLWPLAVGGMALVGGWIWLVRRRAAPPRHPSSLVNRS